jgi:hypothetical protein
MLQRKPTSLEVNDLNQPPQKKHSGELQKEQFMYRESNIGRIRTQQSGPVELNPQSRAN